MAIRKPYADLERPISGLGLVNPPPIRVEFGDFDGSLGHLFSCVRERKIDLDGVPLLPICEAYFHYLMSSPELNLDESAAALAALAYLLERKAWLLLPLPEAPIVEQEELFAIGEASIHEFFDAISFLRNGFQQRSLLFFRAPNQGPHPYELPYQMESLTIQHLAEALESVLATLDPVIPENITRIGRSLALEMRMLLPRISRDWKSLGDLLAPQCSKEDAVYVFLSLLELIRLGQVQTRFQDDAVQFSQS